MATLIPLQAQRTREPVLAVDNRLEPGRHRFRLEVVDAGGRRSRPDELIVEVARVRGLPAAAVDPTLPAVPAAPRRAPRTRTRKPGAERS
jgi:hypothetical protein